jgi:protein SCO1/2
MLRGRSAAAVGALTLALATAGCSSTDDTGRTDSSQGEPPVTLQDATASPLHGTLVDPPLPRPAQVLRDTAGEHFSFADRPEDELSLLFFGYTHCPDVCPTTMADLASARAQLPASLRQRVTVVFVTEDPERDTPRSLRRWLDGFDPSFVGLRGGNKATEAMLDELYLPPTTLVEKPEDPIEHPDNGAPHHHHGDYGVEHAGVVYAFAPGDHMVIYTGGTRPSEYAADFTQLLRGSGGR